MTVIRSLKAFLPQQRTTVLYSLIAVTLMLFVHVTSPTFHQLTMSAIMSRHVLSYHCEVGWRWPPLLHQPYCLWWKEELDNFVFHHVEFVCVVDERRSVNQKKFLCFCVFNCVPRWIGLGCFLCTAMSQWAGAITITSLRGAILPAPVKIQFEWECEESRVKALRSRNQIDRTNERTDFLSLVPFAPPSTALTAPSDATTYEY